MHETQVNKDLLLEFFLGFAKFEYALKTTGFFRKGKSDAMPDWDLFALSLRGSFQPIKTPELKKACDYLWESPPNKQVIVSAQAVGWETFPRDVDATPDVETLLRMVRCVRNNLFHGGKFSNETHETSERTELLLIHCLAVLRECLELSPRQQAAYSESSI